MSKRRLKRETLNLVREMYDAAKARPGSTADMAEQWETSQAMEKAKSEEERSNIWRLHRHLKEWQVGSSGWLPEAARRLEALARRL